MLPLPPPREVTDFHALISQISSNPQPTACANSISEFLVKYPWARVEDAKQRLGLNPKSMRVQIAESLLTFASTHTEGDLKALRKRCTDYIVTLASLRHTPSDVYPSTIQAPDLQQSIPGDITIGKLVNTIILLGDFGRMDANEFFGPDVDTRIRWFVDRAFPAPRRQRAFQVICLLIAQESGPTFRTKVAQFKALLNPPPTFPRGYSPY